MLKRKVVEDGDDLLPDYRGGDGSPSTQRRGNINVGPFQADTTQRRIWASLGRYWYEDLPPLHGPIRITFYLGVLFVVHNVFHGAGVRGLLASSCRDYVSSFRHYDGWGFQMKRGMGVVGLALSAFGLDAPEKYLNCDLLANAVRWGLGLSGIGLGGRVPRVITAIAWWTMFGVKISAFGRAVGHELYLPGVAFVALCFAEGNLIDGWSVDSQLVKVLRRTGPSTLISLLPIAPQSWDGGPSPGRAARKIILFQATCVMFFAGVHKFASYGFKWMDGGTIFYSMKRQTGRARALQKFVLKHAWFFAPNIGSVSLVGELCAIVAVFSPRWRPAVVGSWVFFHVGVMMLMHPNFALNMLTYILFIDWRAVLLAVSSRLSPSRSKIAVKLSIDTDQELPRNLRIGVSVYTATALAMFVSSMLRLDYFPFSGYVLYNYHPADPGVLREITAAEAINTARKCVRQPPLNPACDNLGGMHHHGMFSHARHYTVTVLVTALADDDPSDKKSKNHCHPNELRVYEDWEPHSCWSRDKGRNGTDAGSVSEHIRNILRAPLMRKKGGRRPKDLPDDFWESDAGDGIGWRMGDAVAASIDEGPRCFAPFQSGSGASTSRGVNWMARPSPASPASRLARRLRSRLSGSEYIRDGETVLGMGIFFEFIDESDGEPENQFCKMGESYVGDEYLMARQSTEGHYFHLIAEPGEGHLHKRNGNWTDVSRGMLLVALILFVIFKRMNPSGLAGLV